KAGSARAEETVHRSGNTNNKERTTERDFAMAFSPSPFRYHSRRSNAGKDGSRGVSRKKALANSLHRVIVRPDRTIRNSRNVGEPAERPPARSALPGAPCSRNGFDDPSFGAKCRAVGRGGFFRAD